MSQLLSDRGLRCQVSSSWHSLVSVLADTWDKSPLPPFETELVLVTSSGVGKVLAQQLAKANDRKLNICAGSDFWTIDQYRQQLTAAAGITEPGADPWRIKALTFTIAELLETLLPMPAFQLVADHLGKRHDRSNPGKWLATANRFAQVFSSYATKHPQLLRAWSNGEKIDLSGHELTSQYLWQYQLWQALLEKIDVADPTARTELLANAPQIHGRLQIFAPDKFTALDLELITALAETNYVEAYLINSSSAFEQLKPKTKEIVNITAEISKPELHIHATNTPNRQVEVLRDTLCGLFEENPDLEPRDVIVFCPELDRYASFISAYFSNQIDDGHPGRELRVQLAGKNTSQHNEVLELLIQLLKFPNSRALITDLVRFCSLIPVAHKFNLTEDSITRIQRLLTNTNVRWGIDATQRERQFDLKLAQNTWLMGLDQLLAGIAMPGDELIWLNTVIPSDLVSSSDADLVGNLAEIISRIRQFGYLSDKPMKISDWIELLNESITKLADLPFDSSWMLYQANNALAQLNDQLGSSAQLVSRIELASIFDRLISRYDDRVNFGNGSLIVTKLEELTYVPHKVVCLLGVKNKPNVEDFGDSLIPTEKDNQIWQTLSAATEYAVVVYESWNQNGQKLSEPVQLTSVLAAASKDNWKITKKQHQFYAYDCAEFSANEPFSFDVKLATAIQTNPKNIKLPVQLPKPTAIDLDELISFLDNPARYYLKYHDQLPEEPRIYPDSLPLEVASLERWQIGNRLLRLAEQGIPQHIAIQAEWRRGTVGPGQLGQTALNDVASVAYDIYSAASSLQIGPAKYHDLSLDINQITITGRLATYESALVETVFSRTDEKYFISTWLKTLFAIASGFKLSSAAVLGSPDYDRENRYRLTKRELKLFDKQQAIDFLSHLVNIYQSGIDQVVPLPARIGIAVAGSARYRKTLLAADISKQHQRSWKFLRNRSLWEKFFPTLEDLLAVSASSDKSCCRTAELATAIYQPLLENTKVEQL